MTEVARGFVFLCSYLLFAFMVSGSLACIALLGHVLWPVRTAAATEALRSGPVRCFLIGILNTVGILVLAGILSHVGHGGRLLALVLIVALLAMLASGLPALFSGIGAEMLRRSNRSGSLVGECFAGSYVLGGAGLLPWLGWALYLFAWLAAVGAGVTVLLNRPLPATPPEPS